MGSFFRLAVFALAASSAVFGQGAALPVAPAPPLEQALTAAGESVLLEQAAASRARAVLSRGGAIKAEDKAFLEEWLPKLLAKGLIGRAPTAYEKGEVHGWFPKLAAKSDWRVTGEACDVYNCIAWSVGLVNSGRKWKWPSDRPGDFDAFYLSYGYVPLAAGEPEEKADVAFWVGADGGATHGCRRVTRELWESKLGSSLRILHRLNELESDDYGRVAKLYRRATPEELSRLGVAPLVADAPGTDPCAARASTKRLPGAPYDMGSPRSDRPR